MESKIVGWKSIRRWMRGVIHEESNGWDGGYLFSRILLTECPLITNFNGRERNLFVPLLCNNLIADITSPLNFRSMNLWAKLSAFTPLFCDLFSGRCAWMTHPSSKRVSVSPETRMKGDVSNNVIVPWLCFYLVGIVTKSGGKIVEVCSATHSIKIWYISIALKTFSHFFRK